MVEIRLEIGDPKSKKTYSKKISEEEASKLYGLKINDTFRGEVIGLTGYELLITGGSDDSGFPMRKSLIGRIRKKLLLSGGAGFNPKRQGERKRKTVRGNEIGPDVVQINCKVIKEGKQPITKVLGLEENKEEAPQPEEKAEKPAEAPKDQKSEEGKE